jgi:hypothetical protein
MRANTLAACGVLVAGIGISAQTPQTPPQPSTPSASPTPMEASGTVTVTGCLGTWDGKSTADRVESAAPSSSPSATGSAAGTTYMLTSVQAVSSSASAPGGSAASSYLLKPDSSVNLSAHLNHKVQITGSVDNTAAARSGTSGDPNTARPGVPNPTDPTSDKPATASGAPRTHDMGSMKPATLKVTTVTMVSATCP